MSCDRQKRCVPAGAFVGCLHPVVGVAVAELVSVAATLPEAAPVNAPPGMVGVPIAVSKAMPVAVPEAVPSGVA